MKVTVFGANGKVGSLVVEGLLSRGHYVRAFVYNESRLPEHPHMEVVEGDIHNHSDVDRAVQGADAVISTLGSWHTPQKDILTAGMTNIIPAMEANGVSRIVSLTGADARDPTDKPNILQKLVHTSIKLIAPNILKDGEDHIALLRNSNLNWTVLRSPVMRGEGKQGYKIQIRPLMPWSTIVRQDVADAIVELVEGDTLASSSPYISRK